MRAVRCASNGKGKSIIVVMVTTKCFYIKLFFSHRDGFFLLSALPALWNAEPIPYITNYSIVLDSSLNR